MTVSKPRVRMRLDFDGEPTDGLLLVEQMLIEGRKDEVSLDRETAESAIEALELLDLPWVFSEMVEGGDRLAEQIHSQATQGLQEMVQNAQDQGARHVRFATRQRKSGSELLIAHDGSPVYLHDVVSMAYPLLSGSRKSAEKIGRFGIGLKTLNQFGDRIEVHCPPLPGFEIQDGHIHRVKDISAMPGFWNPKAHETLFVLRLKDERFDLKFFRDWIENWHASSLIFLNTLHSISLVDLRKRKKIVEHALKVAREDDVHLSFQRAVNAKRTEIRQSGSRHRWALYRVSYPVPREMKRINKAIGTTVELAIVISNRDDGSRFFAGLPLNELSTLPFSCHAPFDINVDRTSLLDNNKLNEWLLARLGDLAVAAAEHSFRHHPKESWQWVPLSSESAGASGTWLRTQVDEVCDRIRKLVSARVRVEITDSVESKLSELLVEASPLDSLFDPQELERLDVDRLPAWRHDTTPKHPIPRRYRDTGRWREVLDEVRGTRSLSVEEALAALSWTDEELGDRGHSWLVRFVSAALDEGADDDLFESPCLVLEGLDGRQTPADLVSKGRLLVAALPSAGIAALLGRANRLAPPFRQRSREAKQVTDWLTKSGVLHKTASDALILEALSNASGEEPLDLSGKPDLVRRLRNGFEQLSTAEREGLGPGVGRNIMLDGFEYDARGRRVSVAVSPSSAYVPYKIEKVEGWPTAAGKTQGIRWLDDTYAELLRTSRDDAAKMKRQGALAFLRSIGAATAPRLHQGLVPNADPHALLPKGRLTKHQLDQLADYPNATTLKHDWDSLDLKVVLDSIVSTRGVKQRRKRSRALFKSLNRAWNQHYAGQDVATAAYHYHTWKHDGPVSATWIGRLASDPWLSTRERRFTPKPPRELAVLTEASYEIEGEHPARYAYELEPEDIDSPLIEVIGLEGKPSVETIIQRLADLRDAEADGAEIKHQWVDRCYRALSTYCPGGSHANDVDIPKTQWRAWFGTKSGSPGLIRCQSRWLSIPDVRQGEYLGDRVPWVETPTELWKLLDVPTSDVLDCRRVIEDLAKENADEIGTEILVLRRLISLADKRGLRKTLAGMPIRTYSGWSAESVYAVRNRNLAEEIGIHWPVWHLPIMLDEAKPLLDVLGIVLLDHDAFQPDLSSDAAIESDLQADFPAIVTHLKNYLVLHQPDLLERVAASQWEELTDARAIVGSAWAAKVKAKGRRALRITPRAHVFRTPLTFCVGDEEDAGNNDAGGLAIAGYLLGDDASAKDRAFIALAWESAFRRRSETGESINVDAPTTQDGADTDEVPDWLRRRGAKKRAVKGKMRKRTRREKEKPRQLVEPSEIDLADVRATMASKGKIGKLLPPPKKKLVNPKAATPSPRGGKAPPIAGDRHYTATEREDVGYLVSEAYLREAFDLHLDDVRSQGNVGADAIDREKDIWVELKTFGRDRTNIVRLERSEAIRAKEKGEHFWLVLAWNLERPRIPELLIVQNPLAKLDAYVGNGIRLVGLDDVAAES